MQFKGFEKEQFDRIQADRLTCIKGESKSGMSSTHLLKKSPSVPGPVADNGDKFLSLNKCIVPNNPFLFQAQ